MSIRCGMCTAIALLISACTSNVVSQEQLTLEDDPEWQRMLKYFRETDEDAARETWTYEHLFKSSQAVVLGEFVNTVENPRARRDGVSVGDIPGTKEMAESEFIILAVVQPDKEWKRQPMSVYVRHVVLPRRLIKLARDKPIDFRAICSTHNDMATEATTNQLNSKRSQRERSTRFLMFLVADPDGKYQPVTGQYFPGLSFRTINEIGD